MTIQAIQREQIILNLNAQVQSLTARVEALEKEKKGAEDR
jgi:outer membrane murein-binding lipoprotein Lpp